MERLRIGELERLRSFLQETSLPCDLATFGTMVLPAVQKLVPSVVVCYAQIDPAQQKMVAQETYPSDEVFKNDGTFDEYIFDHPVFREWGRTGEAFALRTSDFYSKREWHRFSLYQMVYKQWGCDDSLAIGLPAPPGLIACICSERDASFTESERFLMNLVRPHLAQAYRSAELFSLLGNPSDSTGLYTMIVDSRGHPLFAPPAVWELIDRYLPGPTVAHWGLPEALINWLTVQLSRFTPGFEAPPPASPLVIQHHDGRSLTLRLLRGHLTGEQSLLVFQEKSPGTLEAVASGLGLTEREQEILRAAGEGLSSAEIAESLFISRRTVEKHLENIYGKLGVESRSAAIARAFLSGQP